jgi:hypothetical protein
LAVIEVEEGMTDLARATKPLLFLPLCVAGPGTPSFYVSAEALGARNRPASFKNPVRSKGSNSQAGESTGSLTR